MKKILFEHRSGEGGFYGNNSKIPDINSTFKCLAILHFINADLNIDEKKMVLRFINSIIMNSGLARHCLNKKCKCGGKTSIEYTFYAISSLILLDSLDELEEQKIKSLTSSRILYSENKLVYRLLTNQFLYYRQKYEKSKGNRTLDPYRPLAGHAHGGGLCRGCVPIGKGPQRGGKGHCALELAAPRHVRPELEPGRTEE